MTAAPVYVAAKAVENPPKLRHLPRANGRAQCSPYLRLATAESNAAARARWQSNPSRAKPIDYEALPLCRLCAREASKA